MRCKNSDDKRGGKGATAVRGVKGVKGVKGGKKCPAQVHILLWRHPYLLPHTSSQFEGMRTHIAIRIQERGKMFLLKGVSLQIFTYLISIDLCSQVPFKESLPPCALQRFRHGWVKCLERV